MMTRDDMLRELELLPAWKLRAQPAATELAVKTQSEKAQAEKVQAEKVQPEKAQVKQLLATEITTISEPEKLVINQNIAPIQYEITLSQDKHWAFICMPADLMDAASQSMLFNNILHAIHIETPTKTQANDTHAKIIVVMGESVAQTLLSTQQPLENLRGELHPIGDSKLIATYDLAHLLANPLDKAKVWQDLCLARAYLQSLHPQNLQSQD